jgi:hypothetical protein
MRDLDYSITAANLARIEVLIAHFTWRLETDERFLAGLESEGGRGRGEEELKRRTRRGIEDLMWFWNRYVELRRVGRRGDATRFTRLMGEFRREALGRCGGRGVSP